MSKIPINPSTSYAHESTQNQITSALIASGSIPSIQQTLLHELQASGWTTSLRTYITQLMRSGECTKYDDIMDKVLAEVGRVQGQHDAPASSGRAKSSSNTIGVNGAGAAAKGDAVVDLKIPIRVQTEGMKVVKRELEKVCDFSDG